MPVPLANPFGRQVRAPRTTLGSLLSAVLHLAVIGALAWHGQRVAAEAARAAGSGPGPGGGGGGGWGRALALFSAPAAEAATPPPLAEVELPSLELPEVVLPVPDPEPVALDSLAPLVPAAVDTAPARTAAAPGEGPGQGAGVGTGAGPGSGGGTGGGAGGGVGSGIGPDSGGAGGRIFPPQPQGIILPPMPSPRRLRGSRVTVTFTIGERGEVLDVRVSPTIPDRAYLAQFLERMRRYTFTPGYTRDGRPVRAELPIAITL
jgi:protein TonB